MLPFLSLDPDAEESTGGGAAVAEDQTPDTPGESQGELFDDASPATPSHPATPSATPDEDSTKTGDAGDFVGLRQTAQQGNDSDHVPFKTVGDLPDAALDLLAALLLAASTDERQEEEVDDTEHNCRL